jgi:hypothetical protein
MVAVGTAGGTCESNRHFVHVNRFALVIGNGEPQAENTLRFAAGFLGGYRFVDDERPASGSIATDKLGLLICISWRQRLIFGQAQNNK